MNGAELDRCARYNESFVLVLERRFGSHGQRVMLTVGP
jgi:hypothetical protein